MSGAKQLGFSRFFVVNNPPIQGKVEHVLRGGEGLIHSPQGDVLLPHVIAGESVSYHISQKRRGILRGTCTQVHQASAQRIQPRCPIAQDCGGCALQHMSHSAQAELKSAWVKDAFSACIQHDTTFIPVQSLQHNNAGRRRVRWFLQQHHGERKLGFYQRYSHDIAPTPYCPALSQQLEQLRQSLQQQVQNLPESIQSIQAIELSNGIHLILESEHQQGATYQPPHLSCNPSFDLLPIQWWWRKLNTTSIKPLTPPQALYDSIDLQPFSPTNIHIHIGANDFVQGNQQGNQSLIQQILSWTKTDKRIVDLFSGCGNLSLPIAAAHQSHVIGAEINVNSVQAANHNAQRLKLHAQYHHMDLFGSFNIEPFIAADTLIIDPPRQGAKRICQKIQQFFPKQIIMVNCDPAAGARDGKALQHAGFHLKSLRALDLFPFTGHVEAVSLWTTS